jgi:hypothetical protein
MSKYEYTGTLGVAAILITFACFELIARALLEENP